MTNDRMQAVRCERNNTGRGSLCRGFARYVCRNPACAKRTCGRHVNRSDNDATCPWCGGALRVAKH